MRDQNTPNYPFLPDLGLCNKRDCREWSGNRSAEVRKLISWFTNHPDLFPDHHAVKRSLEILHERWGESAVLEPPFAPDSLTGE